jgi:hypothetical protein
MIIIQVNLPPVPQQQVPVQRQQVLLLQGDKDLVLASEEKFELNEF